MSMDTASIMSLKLLEHMQEAYPNMNNKNKAKYALLLVWASDKNSQDIQSYEDILDNSIQYYEESNNKPNLSLSFFYKSRIYRYKDDYANAIKYLLKAKDLSDPNKDFSLLGKIYSDFGQISILQDDLQKAIEYFEQSAFYFEKSGEKNNLSKVYMLIGWINGASDELQQSINFTFKALELTTDSITIGDLYNDIGKYHYLEGANDSALYYLKKSLRYPYYSTNLAIRYANLGYAFYHMQEYDSAIVYVNEALQNDINIYTERDCYKLLFDISIETDNMNTAIYMSELRMLEDSIKKLEKQPEIAIVEQLHHSEKVVENISNQKLFLVVFIIVLSLFGALLLGWLYKRGQKEKNKAVVYKEELEKKQEQSWIEFHKELERTKEKYASHKKNVKFDQREEIDRIVYNEVLHLNDETTFINKMNNVLNHLPDKLKKDYPAISYKEIVWCCLFILDIPTTDISMLLNYTQSSQYKFKQRLTKKLGFSNSKELEKMIHKKTDINESI